jgi:hypothetical protein
MGVCNLLQLEDTMYANRRIPDFPEPTFCGLRRWFRHMFAADLLYHPDEPAQSIVRLDTRGATFTAEECVELNAAVESLFSVHGDLVYTVGLHFAHKAVGTKPECRAAVALAG